MIIDAHAHLVAPASLYAFKANLLADGGYNIRSGPRISNDELADVAGRNVALLDEVGTNLQILSPRPFHQMNSVKPARLAHIWIAANNDLIARTVDLYPDRFAGMAGLPVTPGEPVETCFRELDRCVNEMNFVGVSLNPDPMEGTGFSPPMGEEYWYPLYERLIDLDVPALIHSSGCYSGRESYSEHFISEASIAIGSLLRSNVIARSPDLKLIVSHGGGSVPYQIGRWQAERLHPGLGDPSLERFEVSLRRLYFDTVLHNPPSLELLLKTVGPDRCLFGTERPGSGSARNDATGRDFDDLKPVLEDMDFLTADDLEMIFERNARVLSETERER